jgi:hypothetical protein
LGFRDDIIGSPTIYPLGVDLKADGVQFVQLSRADYDAIGFHDRRMLTPQTKTAWAKYGQLEEAARGLPVKCHFIFHISHVGSTLLSRLVGSHPEAFGLREPGVLRAIAEVQQMLGKPGCPWTAEELNRRLWLFLGVWSRTFSPRETAVIKCTSYVSEMAEMLMERVAGSKAILMYVKPSVFLPQLLGGAMVDIEGKAASRLERLHARLGVAAWSLAELSPGERVSMSWLCEMLAMDGAARRFESRCQWLDFDGFLEDSQTRLVACLEHLKLGEAEANASRILAGPLMKQYSKATQFEFDAGHRERILQEAKAKHAAEIAKGLAWIEAATEAHEPVRHLMGRLDGAGSA